MSYAPLSPDHCVILFADLQDGIVERATTIEPARLRKGVTALAKLARLYDIPFVVTTAPAGAGEPRLIPEIPANLEVPSLNVRTTTDAFLHAATRQAIEKSGRKTLLIAGVATEIIVQHSALSGLAHGFAVQVVVDACGGISTRTEDAALMRMSQAGAVLASMPSIAGQLAGDFTQPKAGEALCILYEMAS